MKPVVYKNNSDLTKTFKELRKTGIAGRKKVKKLAAMTSILDVLEKIRLAKSKSEFNKIVKEHKTFLKMVQENSNASKLAFLKSNPLLACVADETGGIEIGDHKYDVFDPKAVQSLSRMIPLPPDDDPGGGGGGSSAYTFTELPPEELVQGLPCGPWTVLPGYPTKFFDANINGRTVVVQLWKGLCPDYLGQGPGGVGAEVGLYNRDPWLPNVFWWPDHQHKQAIEFTLMNPKTNAEFFSARAARPIWWLHKWMKGPSYAQYVRDQKQNVPAAQADYVLHSKISGTSFVW